jgi:hypothetical protein
MKVSIYKAGITLICISLFGLLISCNNESNSEGSYSFFVAGHAYGSPNGTNAGLHPPFLNVFDYLNNHSDIEFGVLTGDIVRKGTIEAWDSVDHQLSKLRMPVHFSPGNHDTYNRELYELRYGNGYFSFVHKNNLHIVLDANLDKWNITGMQMDFLDSNLQTLDPEIKNVFVFVHQLIWWDDENIFAGVNLNWPPYTPDSTNFWAELEPKLQSCIAPVYIFAGDLGANNKATSVMFYPDRNITYIASGMGNMKTDNILIVHVNKEKGVHFELIALQGEKNKLGQLEDFLLYE